MSTPVKKRISMVKTAFKNTQMTEGQLDYIVEQFISDDDPKVVIVFNLLTFLNDNKPMIKKKVATWIQMACKQNKTQFLKELAFHYIIRNDKMVDLNTIQKILIKEVFDNDSSERFEIPLLFSHLGVTTKSLIACYETMEKTKKFTITKEKMFERIENYMNPFEVMEQSLKID